MNIVLFGGSFNPVHNGHLQIISELLKKLDEVWVVPCGNHAFDKELADGDKRIEMLKLAIKNPGVKILDMEIKKKEKSYSADIVRDFRKEYPDHKFFLVIGADNLDNLQKWHDFQFLKNEVEFIIVSRPGFELTNKNGIRINYVLAIENFASSTQIRNNIESNISIKQFVPKSVCNFLIKNEIYQNGR